jgi:hypothetical protein
MSADKQIEIINADRLDKTRVIVDFSDGTTATFTANQLTELEPKRENATGFSDRNRRGVV